MKNATTRQRNNIRIDIVQHEPDGPIMHYAHCPACGWNYASADSSGVMEAARLHLAERKAGEAT